MLTVLEKQQFCVVLDPVSADGKQQLGKKELRKGPTSFFLKPGKSVVQYFISCKAFVNLFYGVCIAVHEFLLMSDVILLRSFFMGFFFSEQLVGLLRGVR